VVEDEAIQREALAAMCRAALEPAQVEVIEAGDGLEAVKSARALAPDLVLMDIRMPRLDGMESASRIVALGEGGPSIVFITAYDDFTYARQALSIGASDYLLKPVDPEELRKVLGAAVERAAEAARTAARAERTARRLRAAMPLLRVEAFRDLLDGALVCPGGDPVLADRLSLAGVDGQPSLAMFFEIEASVLGDSPGVEGSPAGPGTAPGRISPAAEAAVAAQDMAAAVSRLLRRRLGSAWLAGPAGPDRHGLFVRPPAASNKTAVRDWALELAADLQAEGRRLFGRSVSAGVGEHHPEEGGLTTSAQEATTALAHRTRLGPGCLVHITDVRGLGGPGPHVGDLALSASLLDAIRLGNPNEAAGLAAKLSRDIILQASRMGDTRSFTQVLASEVLVLAGRAALDGGAEPSLVRPLQARSLRWLAGGVGEEAKAVRAGPAGSMATTQAGRVLEAFARELGSLTRAAQENRQGGVVRRALAYIRANFARPLTLEEVAREVHVSHYYLSHLLKRESGKGFSEHLTELRMNRASELLTSTDLAVHEIADRVGFADGNYFARVFKRETGLTPSAYRGRVGRRG